MRDAPIGLDRRSRKISRSRKIFESAAKVAVSFGWNRAAPGDALLAAFDINPRS
jgi:hypothetical protein